MMKSRWLSLILAIVMTAVAFPAGFSIYGEENIEMVEKLFITYENLKTTEEFGANSEGLGVSPKIAE